MVRPRASDRNLKIAVAFGRIVVMRYDAGVPCDGVSPVSCSGGRSIFPAFATCFPDLARDARDKRPKNRQAVAAIELNKGLQLDGLRSVRKQERVDGTRSRSKVCACVQRWKV